MNNPRKSKYFKIFIALSSFFLLWGGWKWLQIRKPMRFDRSELHSFAEDLKPLLNVIASGEGGYTSVNRGSAGDSRGDWAKKNLGKSITEMTVAELRSHQAGSDPNCWYKGKAGEAKLYAVGKFQLIPCTLQGATRNIPDFDMNELYNPTLQELLGVYLLLIKRPVIREYLAGIHDNHQEAGQELAKEFASIPAQYANSNCQRGQSYYCGKNNNAAHIKLETIDAALKNVRAEMIKKGKLRLLISQKELTQHKIRRYLNQTFDTKIF